MGTNKELLKRAKKFVWEKEVGSISNEEDSNKELRKIRKILSIKELDKINNL